ncbi:Uncharacterised protein [Mycobacterium tuberculosis]|nr:Uncharacterised protein [Mycobacterium tuberculosis]
MDVSRCFSVEQGHEQAFMQFGADEAQPLLQPAALDPGIRADASLRKMVGDVLQDRCVLGEDEAVIGTDGWHEA